jgi:two-component system, OmpR family, response regulator
VVDDDATLVALLAQYLTFSGLEVHTARGGPEALALCDSLRPDLMILDVSMPGMDGFEVLRRLRSRHGLPVLFLTARDDEIDRIMGLEAGADDYLTKPFSSRELLARIHAILRRATVGVAGTSVSLGALSLDRGSRVVRMGSQKVDLTDAEYRILEALALRAGHVVSRAELSQIALGKPHVGLERSVDTHVSTLRRKLGPVQDGTSPLVSVRNQGYLLRKPDATVET